MRILELDMKHFGKFENHRMRFTSGVNIVYGGNETGKSTIHAFIRAMFYGIEPSRNRSGRPGEYELRQPWENGTWFAGSMRLLYDRRVYRIERNFYRQERSLQIVCETDGQVAEDPRKLIDSMLEGMDEAAFRNTVFIPQAGAGTDQGLSQQLQNFFVNMQESGDGSVDVQAALGRLQARRKKLEKEKAALLEQLDGTIAARTMEQRYLEQELDRLHSMSEEKPISRRDWDGEIALTWYPAADEDTGTKAAEPSSVKEPANRDQNNRNQDERNQVNQKPDDGQPEEVPSVLTFWGNSRRYRNRMKRYMTLLAAGSVLIMLLAIACGIAAPSLLMKITMFSIALFFVLLLLLLQSVSNAGTFTGTGNVKHTKHEKREEEAVDSLREKQPEKQAEGETGDRGRNLKELTAQTHTQIANLQEELKDLYRRSEELARFDRECEAIDLAADRIRTLSKAVFQESGKEFAASVSEILEQLTEGQYTSISLDERMNVRVNTPDKLLDLSQVSFAAMNQIYFALRMAAAQLLGSRTLPLILDEPFAMYDNERLEAALQWLENCGRQVIVFTCQAREKALLDQIRKA